MASMKNKAKPNPDNADTQKQGKAARGNQGSKGQNARAAGSSVGSHKPGGDGPGTKKFKHEHDDKRKPE